MVVGQPPFYADTPEQTQNKVLNWKTTLHIPPEAQLSQCAKDLIMRLCCGPETRLGKNGADEIKDHSYFNGIDFDPVSGLRKKPAPHVPNIRSADDTSNFDTIDEDKLHSMNELNENGQTNGMNKNRNHMKDYYNSSSDHGKHPDHAFFEFTFRRFFDDGGHPFPMRLEHESKDCNGHALVTNGNHAQTGSEPNQGSPVYV
jgi:serine/threonine-protein kinase LATS1/2